MDQCNTRVNFYVRRVSEGLLLFEDIRVVLKDVVIDPSTRCEGKPFVTSLAIRTSFAKILKN